MTLLEADDLSVDYAVNGVTRRAVRSVSLRISAGEAVGVIGESGSGKSTLARAIVGLEPLAGGQVSLSGGTVAQAGLRRARNPAFAKAVQFMFQDAAGALNPRMANWLSATEPAVLLEGVRGGSARRALAQRLFEQTSLPTGAMDAYPHVLSGGQRQRLALCRALSVSPKLMVLDEPTSALDVSVQARILDQFLALNTGGTALLLISHDVAVVRHLCTRIVVMRRGEIVEDADRETLFTRPAHPYTMELLSSAGYDFSDAPLQAGRDG